MWCQISVQIFWWHLPKYVAWLFPNHCRKISMSTTQWIKLWLAAVSVLCNFQRHTYIPGPIWNIISWSALNSYQQQRTLSQYFVHILCFYFKVAQLIALHVTSTPLVMCCAQNVTQDMHCLLTALHVCVRILFIAI